MPKISQLNPISQLTTSSILPVVDNNQTQKVTLQRVIEFVSASIDVTFATEIELLQSASSITSSLNAFASSSILSVNSKLSTSSFEAYTASVSVANVDTSSLLSTSSFNTFTSSVDNRLDVLEGINVTPFLSSSTFNSYTSSNETTNTTQNSRLTSLENNSGSYLLKSETGSFITSLPNNLISGSSQISELGYATTSSVLNIDTSSLVTTSSFNTYTASISTASLVSRLNSIESFTASLDATFATDAQLTALSTSVAVMDSGQDSKINSLTNATGSYITSAQTASMNVLSSSYAVTASFALNAGESIDTGSLLTTSSFNSYTQSASTNVSGAINTATGSSLVTASFSSQTLTFTKGDGSQFSLSIPDVSGSTIDTGSLINSIATKLNTGSYNIDSQSFDSRINNLTESVFTHVVTDSGGVFVIDSISQPILSFVPGATYRFNTSAVEGSHPFKFSTSPDGPTQYTTGVISGSNFIQIEVNYDTPTKLYYYCAHHSGMGNEINTLRIDTLTTTSSFNSFTSLVNTATSSLNSFTSSINSTIKSKLNTDGVISGSSQLPSGIISGSSQLPSGIISGSSQLPSGIISSSAQISASGFVSSSNVSIIQTITSASYAALTPVSGTLYIIIG